MAASLIMLGHIPVIAGTDEVGRGPLAGPVVAAAVIINKRQHAILLGEGLRDSKKISHKIRMRLFLRLSELGVVWRAQAASPQKIDSINILQASLWCMRRAIEKLPIVPDLVLVDGNQNIPNVSIKQKCIVKGDDRVPVIALASVIAKVLRDNAMIELDKIYSEYGFASNKGYPSLKHREKLKKIGPSPIHRMSFRGVLISEENVS